MAPIPTTHHDRRKGLEFPARRGNNPAEPCVPQRPRFGGARLVCEHPSAATVDLGSRATCRAECSDVARAAGRTRRLVAGPGSKDEDSGAGSGGFFSKVRERGVRIDRGLVRVPLAVRERAQLAQAKRSGSRRRPTRLISRAGYAREQARSASPGRVSFRRVVNALSASPVRQSPRGDWGEAFTPGRHHVRLVG